MREDVMAEDKTLQILHDHYKESFAIIREREKQRDLLFLSVIGLLAFLLLILQYGLHSNFEFSALGTKIALKELPFHVLVSANWTFLLISLLRYQQCVLHVENQYAYIHDLEKTIRSKLDVRAYYREGEAYFVSSAALFRNWAWIFYTFLCPTLVVLAAVRAGYIEWQLDLIPTSHRVFDCGVLVCLSVSIVLFFWRHGFPKVSHSSTGWHPRLQYQIEQNAPQISRTNGANSVDISVTPASVTFSVGDHNV